MSDSGAGVTERAFLSIGEVLELLKEEFQDITISKIRFLESQGLLDPERTPSGYRKFYEPDVARLRWILEQQRDHFLPLKVIKDRLLAGPDAAPLDADPVEPAEPKAPPALEQDPIVPPRRHTADSPLVAGLSAVSLTISELAHATGLDVADIQELERYGLLAGRPVAGQVYYDEEALVVARLAAGFARHGVEARHLRMYKTAAEREAGFYEQVVLPLVKQRNPTARRQAVETLEDLSQLGEGMRAAFLRAALREYTDG
ncbi:MAG: putative MerR family transcriptional regulator [Actinomycetia bacterium]|nr:putative MerR family transcriptional regulator [Actinomycetes bacterium]